MAFINSHSSANCAPRIPFALINLHEIDRLNSLPASSIRVYLSIASHASTDGVCWPGRQRIGQQTHLNKEQVSKATSILSMVGLIEKTYRENGSVVYRLPYHQSGPGSDAGPRNLAPGSWTVPEPTPPRVGPDTPPCQNWHPEPTIEPTEERERATAEPAASEPAEQAPLSVVVLRTLKTPPPDTVPETWIPIAADLRPDLPIEAIEKSAARFLDDRRSKGIELVEWLPSWRNWIRNERSQKPVKASNSAYIKPCAIAQPNPYAGWEPGQKAPIGAAVTPEQAIAAFERDMQQVGATKGADGVWSKPTPAPVAAVKIEAAPDPEPGSTVSSTVDAVEIEATPTPITEKPRHSPLHGLLAGLRTPEARKPASVPWQRPAAPIIDPVELAKAEALLAEEVARKKETRYQRGTDSG